MKFLLSFIVPAKLRLPTFLAFSASLFGDVTLTAPYTDSDIITAIASASAGDTVWLESHTVLVDNSIVVNKGISLRAITPGSVVFQDEVANRNNAMFMINFTSLQGVAWVDGIRFVGGSQTVDNTHGCVAIIGSNNASTNSYWRMSHCEFDGLEGRFLAIYAWSGLFDHNTLNLGGSSDIAFEGRIAGGKGHGAWNNDVLIGTVDEGVYCEYNTVTGTGGHKAWTDGFGGARYVVRYNDIYNRSIQNHGTDSTQEIRSARWVAAYGNRMEGTSTSGESAFLYRGGSGVIFDNELLGLWPGLLRTVNYRQRNRFVSYGFADGRSIYDSNGTSIVTGTATAGGSGLLVDSSASWTPDFFIGHEVVNKTTGYVGRITDNDQTSVTFEMVAGTTPTFSAGNNYDIRQVIFDLGTANGGGGH